MTFEEILAQVVEVLQRERRVSYRALRRRFGLDEESLEDLKVEIIQAEPPPQGAVGDPSRATQYLHNLGQRLCKRNAYPLCGSPSNLIRHPFQQVAIRVAGIEAQ